MRPDIIILAKQTDGNYLPVSLTDIAGKKCLDVNVANVTINSDGDSIETRAQAMKTAIDEASSTITYVGEAACGTPVSAAAWRIKRITQSGSVMLIEWANGSSNFNQIWNNRAALTYT